MCGFVSYDERTITENDSWLNRLTFIAKRLQHINDYTAYPAFGGDTSRRIPLVVYENGDVKQVDAIWWFDAHVTEEGVTEIDKRTTFNARNLESSYWKSSLKRNRGLVIASKIGESKLVGKTKHQYLMQSQQPFMLGALYRKLQNGDYTCAIITRDAHPKMEAYHDKAFPLFLPNDDEFIRAWLIEKDTIPAKVDHLLNEPKLYPNLHVQRVKSYKSATPMGNINEHLDSDQPDLLI